MIFLQPPPMTLVAAVAAAEAAPSPTASWLLEGMKAKKPEDYEFDMFERRLGQHVLTIGELIHVSIMLTRPVLLTIGELFREHQCV